MAKKKPYRNLTGFDQFGDEWDYKDLIKKSLTSEDTADTLAASSTIIYSTYTFPLTTKGDLLGHDGTSVVRKGVGANKTALVADSSTSDGLAWRTLNTTKGDILGYDTDLKRVPIGTNDQVLMADSAQTLGLKWASLTTTKGDLLSHDGSDPIRKAVGSDDTVLSADSAQTTGLAWVTRNSLNLGLGGDWIYGDGVDGALTLVADTSLSADDNRKMYSSIDCAGYSLSYTASDFSITVCCSGLCDGNAGQIHSKTRDNGTVGAGGTSANLPTGGAGGDGAGAVFIYAKTMADITCSSAGTDGGVGGNAQHPADASGVNAAGGDAAGAARWRGLNITITQAVGGSTVGGYGIVSTGGAGGSITAANRGTVTRVCRIAMDLVLPLAINSGSTNDWDANTSIRSHHSPTGAGGASGAEDNAAAFSHVSGGGGGGGGAGLFGNGGAGGDGVLSSTGDNERSAPAGGGGGGGGSHIIVITNDGTSVVVSADGGDGGNAGTGGDDGSIAGDGGGGGGGVAVAIGPGITCSADGGTAGSTGNGGTDGSAGRSFYESRA